MKNVFLVCFGLLMFSGILIAQDKIDGKWESSLPPARGTDPIKITMDFKVDGTKLTGFVAVVGRTAPVLIDGKVSEDKVVFTLKSPDGNRTIKLTGKIEGDRIVLAREVEGTGGGTNGIYAGVDGPKSVVIVRKK